ncbi:endonuclease domain-containing protein [Vibrio metschnikovii]|uniref:DUF559 domain-containing protein n=2 Tax=Unclassified Bacteria TaxID=49928 RepID=A0AAU6UQH1_UNCXX|nr:endonuclease domain-containing protein [Vibrio metschnikovii]EKO3719060.1 endonuclease domain-containing protein [Vibrio metschnikovii]EKO3940766.1 endonuclease domain-containing protein [Vibrio metschnikovii]
MRKPSFYKILPYNPRLKEKARILRKAGILHEVLLWQEIKSGKLNGLNFDRQKVIGNYIVDFYCAEKSVVIEVNGYSHIDRSEKDIRREKYLRSLELSVIHISAKDVLQSLSDVVVFLSNHPALQSINDHNRELQHPPRPSGTPPKRGIKLDSVGGE